LFDVVGNAAIIAPEHIALTCENVGVVLGLTVMVIVSVYAHNPAVGVKVYVVVAVLSIVGNQVPVIPLVDVVGKTPKGAPEQIALTCVNVGSTLGLTIMVMVAVFAHNPVVGVKV
jgi:hypothetical protein